MADTQADQLLLIHSAQASQLVGNDSVTVSSGSLSVCSVRSPPGTPELVFVLMQGFACPLVREVPVVRIQPRLYIFPLPPGRIFSIQLDSSVPEEVVDAFEGILEECALFRYREVETITAAEVVTTSTQQDLIISQTGLASSLTERVERGFVTNAPMIAQRIDSSGKKISQALVSGAEVVGMGISIGGEYLKIKLKPADHTAPVSAGARQNIRRARQATGVVVTVSSGVVDGLRAMADALARGVASSINSTQIGQDMGTSPTGVAVRQVAAASLVALSDIWQGIETAVRILAEKTSETTASLIHHKYGPDAADIADDTFASVGNVGRAFMALRNIGFGALARRTASRTGVAIVQTQTSLSSSSHGANALNSTSAHNGPVTNNSAQSLP
mmetsp:Transcript_27093/g.44188  ORF Transcript_27093/g.44188 Transcript_27093/m.44188 type:complete len:388 (+) Transcript_27093:82-1245(+)